MKATGVLALGVLVALSAAVPTRLAPKDKCEGQWTDGTEVAAIANDDQGFEIVKRAVPGAPMQSHELAIGRFNDTILLIGWATLEVHTNPNATDQVQMQAAGFLEGYLTAHRIFQHATNTGNVAPQPNAKLAAFLKDNQAWMADHIANQSSTDPYWHQVDMVLTQLDAVYAGYAAAACDDEASLTKESLLFINLDGDIEDLAVALSGDQARMRDPFSTRGRCTAVVMPTDGNEDLMVAQTTWSSLESMTRIFKLYDFALHEVASGPMVSARRVAFSSYPGALFSGDDFYTLSSGLVVQETTIGNSNPVLYKFIVPACVLEWIRNVVANRLATSGRDWGTTYNKHNSGTYNNMNMVVDMKRFTPGDDIEADVLWMCEQIPGHTACRDMSMTLQRSRYFGSYNIAYDPTIRALSGVDDDQKTYGDWFDYHKHPRALIFERDLPNVQSVPALKRMMRYNNYTSDPLSSQMESCNHVGMTNCTPPYSAENAISCRSDLNPKDGVYAFSALGHRDHVATDAKITAFSMFDKFTLNAVAISGPTNDQQPTFVFSESDYSSVSHVGMPDEWDFPWVEFAWER